MGGLRVRVLKILSVLHTLTFFNIRNGFCNISSYIYFASECHIEETHGGANTKLYDSAGEAANLFCANHVCDACGVQPEAKNSCLEKKNRK